MKTKGIKQVKALKGLKPTKQKLTIEDAIPEDQLNEEAKIKQKKFKK